MLELYHNDMSTCAQKVRCHLAEKGLEWIGHALNLRAGDQHKPEFLALNAKAVVPVLVHEGFVVIESNIIMEYIEDAFPDTSALRPADPIGRARMRSWMQRLDIGLHLDIAVLSIGIAFRHQLMVVHNNEKALEAYYAAIPDPALRAIYMDLVPLGPDAPSFQQSLRAWHVLIEDAEQALQISPYLVGTHITLADLAILPYLCRLDHLQLDHLWHAAPHVKYWFARLRDTTAYRIGIEQWLNPSYLAIMKEKGDEQR